jgi:hypothetical protein
MADNIMGPEVNLGLNVNLDLDRSAQDAATLADQIKQMRVDQEAFRDVIADTQDRLREMTSSYQEQLSLRQQLLDTEQSLRNISDSRTDSLRDQVSAYQQMEQSMSRLAQMMAQSGQMPYGMGGGMGGMGGMSGFYNPMSGMMGNFGGFPSAFSGTPEQEEMEQEEASSFEGQKGRSMEDMARKMFYYTNVPKEAGEFPGRFSASVNDPTSLTNRALRRMPPRIQNFAMGLAADNGALLKELGVRSALPAAAIYGGYKIASDIAKTGQEYGTLTGSNDIAAGYGSKIQALVGSWGGLNPLLPFGVSNEIQSSGLAAGYQFGSSSLNQYRSFASGAYERFGMSPQESQQLFENGVIKAGGSLANLSQALQSTADTAAQTGTSFALAKEVLVKATASFAGRGFGSGAATAAGMLAGSMSFPGNQQLSHVLSGVTDQMVSYGESMTGEALTAQQLGIPWTGLYNWHQTHTGSVGKAQEMTAEYGGIAHLVSTFGLHQGSSQTDFNLAAPRLRMFFNNSLGMSLTEDQSAKFAKTLMNDPNIGARLARKAPRPTIEQFTHRERGGVANSMDTVRAAGHFLSIFGDAINPFTHENKDQNIRWKQIQNQYHEAANLAGTHEVVNQTAYDKAMKQWNADQKIIKQLSIGDGNSVTTANGVTISFKKDVGKLLAMALNNFNANTGTSNANSAY